MKFPSLDSGVADQRPGARRGRQGCVSSTVEAFCWWVTTAQHDQGLLFKEGCHIFERWGGAALMEKGPQVIAGRVTVHQQGLSSGPRHHARPWGYGSEGRRNSLVLWRLPGEWGKQAVIK